VTIQSKRENGLEEVRVICTFEVLVRAFGGTGIENHTNACGFRSPSRGTSEQRPGGRVGKVFGEVLDLLAGMFLGGFWSV
jgi:hypothetical protein